MVEKKETRGGANNTRPQRGENKVFTTITIAPKDRDLAKEYFGGVSQAVVWAVENFQKKIKKK